MIQKSLRILFVLLFAFVFLAVFLLFYFLKGFHADTTAPSFNRGQNAIWLDHRWVDTVYSPETLKALGEELVSHDIRYVYVHTGPFESNGTLPTNRSFRARILLQTLHEHFPTLQWYPWLGQLRSKIDLNSEQVRANMVEVARTLTQESGFDGIHYNIEPSNPYDAGFMALLKQTREALPDTPISLATDEWQPEWLSKWAARYFNTSIVSYWSTEDFKAVMPYVDQVVIMGYDTSLSSKEWYRWFLEQQVIQLTKIAAKGTRRPDAVSGAHTSSNEVENKPPNGPPKTFEVLIGIPAYEKGQEGAFDPAVENIENGLQGILQGLTNWRSRSEAFTGVAIYPYWEMEKEEWSIYEKIWQEGESHENDQSSINN